MCVADPFDISAVLTLCTVMLCYYLSYLPNSDILDLAYYLVPKLTSYSLYHHFTFTKVTFLQGYTKQRASLDHVRLYTTVPCCKIQCLLFSRGLSLISCRQVSHCCAAPSRCFSKWLKLCKGWQHSLHLWLRQFQNNENTLKCTSLLHISCFGKLCGCLLMICPDIPCLQPTKDKKRIVFWQCSNAALLNIVTVI